MPRPASVLVLAALATVATVGSGCIPPSFVRFEAREVRAVAVQAVRDDGVDLVLTAVVHNPNPLAARVHRLSYRIFVAERLLGRGERTGAFDVAARGDAVVDLPVRVAFADLPADLPTLFAGPEVPYRAAVTVDVTSRLGEHHWDLDRRGTVRIADAARMAVAGDFAARVVQVRGVRMRPGLDGLTVAADLEVVNLFPFPLEIRRVDYAVALGGAPLGAGAHGLIALPPRGRTPVTMELKVPLTAIGDVARALGRGPGGMEVRVTGRAHIRPIGGIAVVPFDVRPDPALLRR